MPVLNSSKTRVTLMYYYNEEYIKKCYIETNKYLNGVQRVEFTLEDLEREEFYDARLIPFVSMGSEIRCTLYDKIHISENGEKMFGQTAKIGYAPTEIQAKELVRAMIAECKRVRLDWEKQQAEKPLDLPVLDDELQHKPVFSIVGLIDGFKRFIFGA